MSNERKMRAVDDCKECDQWADVHNPVRIHTVFTSMLDKMEDKVIQDEFKPNTGDVLKVWDAVQDMHPEEQTAKGIKVQWVDLEMVTN